MGLEEAKKLYDSLKDSDDLKIMYKSMIGDWAIDKTKFIAQYTANEALIDKYKENEHRLKRP